MKSKGLLSAAWFRVSHNVLVEDNQISALSRDKAAPLCPKRPTCRATNSLQELVYSVTDAEKQFAYFRAKIIQTNPRYWYSVVKGVKFVSGRSWGRLTANVCHSWRQVPDAREQGLLHLQLKNQQAVAKETGKLLPPWLPAQPHPFASNPKTWKQVFQQTDVVTEWIPSYAFLCITSHSPTSQQNTRAKVHTYTRTLYDYSFETKRWGHLLTWNINYSTVKCDWRNVFDKPTILLVVTSSVGLDTKWGESYA